MSVEQITLLNDFPRSMGCPRQDYIAYNKNDMKQYISERIKNTDLYTSVYKFSTLHFENNEHNIPQLKHGVPYLDKVFFDFDGNEYSKFWLSSLKKLHDWCLKFNILHRAHFSGNGGHFFIYIKPNITYKKEALGNFQRYISKKLKLSLDKKIIGDTSRIFRIPNTYNFKGRRWCVPIPYETLDNSMINENWFLKFSTKKRYINPWCGSNLLNIDIFDVNEILYTEHNIEYTIKDIDKDIKIDYPNFPPCVQSWLSTPNLNSKGKFYLIIYLKDQVVSNYAFDSQDIVSILKKTLHPNEFDHYFGTKILRGHVGHKGKKFKSIMLNSSYKMPSCKTLQKYNLCPFNCGRFNPIYEK